MIQEIGQHMLSTEFAKPKPKATDFVLLFEHTDVFLLPETGTLPTYRDWCALGGSDELLVHMLEVDGIQFFTVSRRHILDITGILQSSFYLERNGSSLCQSLQFFQPIHVFQGQKMLFAFYQPSRSIYQVESQAAELRTRTSIGRTMQETLRGITKSTV